MRTFAPTLRIILQRQKAICIGRSGRGAKTAHTNSASAPGAGSIRFGNPAMTDLTTEARRIAEGMAPAMKKWLPTFSEEPSSLWPVGMDQNTVRRLVRAGLLLQTRPRSGFGFMKWQLSELGLAVRAILTEGEG